MCVYRMRISKSNLTNMCTYELYVIKIIKRNCIYNNQIEKKKLFLCKLFFTRNCHRSSVPDIYFKSNIIILFINFSEPSLLSNIRQFGHALRCKGIPPKKFDLIKVLYDNTTSRVLHERILSNAISISTDV